MDKNKIIIVLLVAIIAILVVGVVAIMPDFNKESSNLTIKSNDTISQGDSIKVKLTDVNGTPIDNETVNITIKDDDGVVEQKSAVTNEKGIAKVKVTEDPGNYTVDCTFAGNDDFTKNTTIQKVEVKKAVKKAEVTSTSATTDPGAFYSAQAGRVIYTGEVQNAPDGHKWKHLGYNEWVKVD